MHELEERPENFDEGILKKLFSAAEFANMTIEQQTDYEIVMRTELDIIAEKNYARETGRAEGRAEGAAKTSREIAAKMLAMGLSPEQISQATGLTDEEIKGSKLVDEHKEK